MPRHNTPEMFWSKVQKTDVCWLWTGYCDENGYGMLNYGSKKRRSHSVAWELVKGERLPKGLMLCHKCDNPPCCNPDHLFVGTYKDNMQDAARKGRLGRQLNWDTVNLIRWKRLLGARPKDLAVEFGVSSVMICRICKIKAWLLQGQFDVYPGF